MHACCHARSAKKGDATDERPRWHTGAELKHHLDENKRLRACHPIGTLLGAVFKPELSRALTAGAPTKKGPGQNPGAKPHYSAPGGSALLAVQHKRILHLG
jgi:hypothetical protein